LGGEVIKAQKTALQGFNVIAGNPLKTLSFKVFLGYNTKIKYALKKRELYIFLIKW
jgi:hypothetical protein